MGPGLSENTAAASPAWNGSELANPHANPGKAGKVRTMFAAIAKSYDLNNRLHSMWQDQRWRRVAVREASVAPGDAVLDVACGTGDLTQLFARTQAKSVTGVDFTAPMLEIARQKLSRERADVSAKVKYFEGDAQALAFPDGSFDVVSIAFGLRNVEQPTKALREFARVLRPGGRLIVLEFESNPPNALVRSLNNFYCGWLMPKTATLISGDTSGAYKYLPASVSTFMPRPELEAAMKSAGFAPVTTRSLFLGICVCYRGVKVR